MLQSNTKRTDGAVRHSTDGRACPFVREFFARIGDKWSVLVVVVLGADGTMRFSELKREILGISQRMLTLTLRNLERDGLIERLVFATVPPRVDYRLTPLGRSLLALLDPVRNWAMEHRVEIESARTGFDSRKDTSLQPLEVMK